MQPQSQNPSSIGEAAITPQTMQQVAPDVQSPQGQQQLFQKAVGANVAKKQLDAVLGAVAAHLGATSSTRVKNIETASQKIAQKRLQGRDYGVSDINDMLGGRIVVKNDKDIPKAKQAMQKLSEAGVFAIMKEQHVKQGTYDGYHYDVKLSNGQPAEVQIHTPQSEAEAVVNHSLRAVHGEKPQDKVVEQMRDKQAQVVKSFPNEKANAVTQIIQGLAKQQKGLVTPQQSAAVLSQASSS